MASRHGMEEYLEAVYVLQAEGARVIPSRLADYLGVARPTVTQTVSRMENAGYATRKSNREVSLTDEGLRLAEAVVRKHRLIERWLADELGLDWAQAHVEAGRLEHAISPLVEERLWQRLGHPTTCPHGNVIPGSGAPFVAGVPLVKMPSGSTSVVIRILEQAEEDLDLLRFLYQAGLVPGAEVRVERQASSFEAGIPIRVGERSYSLTPDVASRILVESLAQGDGKPPSPLGKSVSEA